MLVCRQFNVRVIDSRLNKMWKEREMERIVNDANR